MKTGKIKSSVFKSTWKGLQGDVQYHDITFEDQDGTFNIGSKDKNPDFLAVGASLNYEVPDPSKPNKIKRAKELGASAGFSGGGSKPFDSSGVTVGNALSNASLLIAHGKVDIKDLEKVTRGIVELAFKLKEEFAGR